MLQPPILVSFSEPENRQSQSAVFYYLSPAVQDTFLSNSEDTRVCPYGVQSGRNTIAAHCTYRWTWGGAPTKHCSRELTFRMFSCQTEMRLFRRGEMPNHEPRKSAARHVAAKCAGANRSKPVETEGAKHDQTRRPESAPQFPSLPVAASGEDSP